MLRRRPRLRLTSSCNLTPRTAPPRAYATGARRWSMREGRHVVLLGCGSSRALSPAPPSQTPLHTSSRREHPRHTRTRTRRPARAVSRWALAFCRTPSHSDRPLSSASRSNASTTARSDCSLRRASSRARRASAASSTTTPCSDRGCSTAWRPPCADSRTFADASRAPWLAARLDRPWSRSRVILCGTATGTTTRRRSRFVN